MKKKKIAVTIGDPSGIGPEIVLKALSLHPEIYEDSIPIIYGSPEILKYQADHFNIKTELKVISDPQSITDSSPDTLNIFAVSKEQKIPEFGIINAVSGNLAYKFIATVTQAAMMGEVSAVATAPINKEALKMAKIPYLDHTGIFTKLTNSKRSMTLFMTGPLKVFFYSRHIAFKDIPESLDIKKLVQTLQDCEKDLQQIGIESPRLALAALNPHGGEHGMFGDEEVKILSPAVMEARQEGIDVSGPIPADSVFQLAIEGIYDGVLSLYHDQGHIATKTYDFYKTISLTMGLPFLRTSVDHGTAMNLAGKNIANESSMVEAILAAARYAW